MLLIAYIAKLATRANFKSMNTAELESPAEVTPQQPDSGVSIKRFTMAGAAEETGLHKATIRRAIQAGKLSANRTDKGYSIDAAELYRYFNAEHPNKELDSKAIRSKKEQQRVAGESEQPEATLTETDKSEVAAGNTVNGSTGNKQRVAPEIARKYRSMREKVTELETENESLKKDLEHAVEKNETLANDKKEWREQAQAISKLLAAPVTPSVENREQETPKKSSNYKLIVTLGVVGIVVVAGAVVYADQIQILVNQLLNKAQG